MYWERYSEFRELFGLKLNYSLKSETGINLVHLIKRRPRKQFKPQSGTDQLEPPIAIIEQELRKDGDNSFISDDLFNKSMTSKDSAFTLGHLQKQEATTQSKKDESSLQNFAANDLINPAALPVGQIQDLSAIEHMNDYTVDEKPALLENLSKAIDSQDSRPEQHRSSFNDTDKQLFNATESQMSLPHKDQANDLMAVFDNV